MESEYLRTYKNNCFKRLSGAQLEQELLLLDAIMQPESKHVAFVKKREEIVDDLVRRVLGGELDKYELYNNCSKYFPGVKYPQSHVLQGVVFYRAGKEKLKGNQLSIKELGELWESCGADFFLGYIPERTELEGFIKEADWDTYLKNTRDMEGNNAILLKTVKETYKEIKSDEDIIKGIYQFNNGSYLELPDSVEVLVWMIKLQQRWDLCVKVLEKLQFFPYQGCLIHWMRTVEDCEAVISQLHNVEHEEVLQYLLREHAFHMLYEQENCLKSNVGNVLPKRWADKPVKLLDQWDNDKVPMLQELTDKWLDVFGAEKMSEWVSGKYRHAIGKAEQYRTFDEEILEVIDNKVKAELNFPEIDFAGKDLPTLFNYASTATDVSMSDEDMMSIFRAIVSQVYKTMVCPEWKLNEKGLDLARSVYRLIPPGKTEGVRLLKQKHKPQEGYKVDSDKAFEAAFGDSFLLSVLLLQIEESEDRKRFNELVELLFKYSRNGIMMQDDQFFIPFYIAELIVTFILKDEKDSFELALIEKYSVLSFVLRVLTANGGEMSVKVREALIRRVTMEWQWEKKYMIQRKNKMYEVLDEYIGKVKNTFN